MSTKFMVGYTDSGFSMLGYAGTLSGDRMLGADRRGYDGIVRTEPFDPSMPAHAEYIGTAKWAVERDARRASGSRARAAV